ncbi:MAG: O-antigen ligase family protein [Planctomycetota bacterium]
MTDAARPPLPPWLPAVLAALLCVPFDPDWIDFEQARRALLLVGTGLTAALWPRALAQAPAGDRALLALLAWLVLAAAANATALIAPAALTTLAVLVALLLVARLGAATGSAPWLGVACVVLAVTAAAGLLQRLGVPVPGGTALEPASLFGNRNVAAEVTAVAGAAAALALPRHRRLAAVALVLAGAYTVANGSRSAMVALPAAVAFAAVGARGRPPGERLLPLAALLAGCLLGALTQLLAPLPAGADGAPAPTAAPAPATGAATLEVRREIAAAALRMVSDQPMFGHGPGQFAVQYPRYRSQREIELSSLGRTEQRRVGTAHDDWLELCVEGGPPALLLLLVYAALRWRAARGDRARLAPLVALGLLMLVRAPLGNAPAAALALLASAPLPPVRPPASPPASRGGPHALRLVGVALLALGLALLAEVTCLSRYVASRAAGAQGDPAWLERAVAVWPFDPVPWQLLAQERQLRAADLAGAEAALAAADRAVALRPFEPSYRLLRADLLRLCGRTQDAKQELTEVARLDPGEPQMQVQLAGVYFTEHDPAGATAALYADPPPVLRAQLAQRLDEFAALARDGGDDAAAARFLAEAAFVRALDALGADGPRAQAIAKERFDTMRAAFAAADLHDTDLREYVVLALLALDLGDRDTAAQAAEAATRGSRQLPAWQWPLLREPARRLRDVDAWRELLPPE